MSWKRKTLGLVLFAPALALTSATGSAADFARKYCVQSSGQSEPQAIPDELAPAVAKAFEVDVAEAKAASFYRCVDGRLLACAIGANLNCGKADASREMPAASNFCRKNPDSIGIPMAITGHATIYNWRCVGPSAMAEGPVVKVDEQGYVIDNWKPL